MATRLARRYSGSTQVGSRRRASAPRPTALRAITPRLVGLTTPSSTTTRVDPASTDLRFRYGKAAEDGHHPAVHAHARDAPHHLGPGREDGDVGRDDTRDRRGARGVDQHRPHGVAGAHGPFHHQVPLGDEDAVEVAARGLTSSPQDVIPQSGVLGDAWIVRVGDGHDGTRDGGMAHGARFWAVGPAIGEPHAEDSSDQVARRRRSGRRPGPGATVRPGLEALVAREERGTRYPRDLVAGAGPPFLDWIERVGNKVPHPSSCSST
jgi:hypothetical protein